MLTNRVVEKKGYQVTLDKQIVETAKKYQKELGGAENLSGLIDSLLFEWVRAKELIFGKDLQHLKNLTQLPKLINRIDKEESSKK
jgi:hypothetical protein